MMIHDDVIIRLTKLPLDVEGFSSPSSDGCYNVYINKDLPYERQQEALMHKLNHLHGRDFESGKTLAVLEWRA